MSPQTDTQTDDRITRNCAEATADRLVLEPINRKASEYVRKMKQAKDLGVNAMCPGAPPVASGHWDTF